MNFNDIFSLLNGYYNQPLNPTGQAGLALAQGAQGLQQQSINNAFNLGQQQLTNQNNQFNNQLAQSGQLGNKSLDQQIAEYMANLGLQSQLGNKQLDIGNTQFGQQLAQTGQLQNKTLDQQIAEYMANLGLQRDLGNKQLDIGQTEFGQDLAMRNAAQLFNQNLARDEFNQNARQQNIADMFAALSSAPSGVLPGTAGAFVGNQGSIQAAMPWYLRNPVTPGTPSAMPINFVPSQTGVPNRAVRATVGY